MEDYGKSEYLDTYTPFMPTIKHLKILPAGYNKNSPLIVE